MNDVRMARVSEENRPAIQDDMVPVSQLSPRHGVYDAESHRDADVTERGSIRDPTLGNLSSIRRKIHNLPSQKDEYKRERHLDIYHVNAVTCNAKELTGEE